MIERAHHDGSSLYVANPDPDLGETVDVFVRVPHEQQVNAVHVRTTRDAEPLFVEAEHDRSDDHETWWRAQVKVAEVDTHYRFLLDHGSPGYSWLNATGLCARDVPDDRDFRITTFPGPPTWAQDAVVYQIFPDRFAASDPDKRLPDWAVAADWYDDPVVREGSMAERQVYGGDLLGIIEHLDHIESLGANAVYLTPFFPAQSSHRYNATDFDVVDPILGGDKALIELSGRLHERGIRLLGDLTTNHCGSVHSWFTTARQDPASPEADFFYWQDGDPGYVGWFDIATLPKFNWGSAELRRRMLTDQESIVRRWLRPPYDLDGWRIDVANMTGRYGTDDYNREIARQVRDTATAARPGALILAEHFHDFTRDLTGDGWHGAMNYAGFLRPIWRWLVDPGNDVNFLGMPVTVRPDTGPETVATMDDFCGAVPWRVRTASLIQLDSHDTPRLRTLTGDSRMVEVGAVLLMTMPGIPCVYAGDEIGIEGRNGEDGRRPFPWARPEIWDDSLLVAFRRLGWLRRNHEALRHGGLRWVHVDDDRIVYLRETATERVLVAVSRAAGPDLPLPSYLSAPSVDIEVLYGSEPKRDASGGVHMTGDGPAAHVWRLT